MSETRDLVAEFERIYDEWFDRVGGDPGDFFETTLSEDWVYIDFNGIVRYKPDYEHYIAPVPRDRAPAAPRDLRVRTFGEIAIVDGSYLAPGGGQGLDRELMFTAVWIKRDARWRALAHHTSAVQP
ncbi:MAG: nuclear transport factor 2 family protein [Acidimicrobiia bacterium]